MLWCLCNKLLLGDGISPSPWPLTVSVKRALATVDWLLAWRTTYKGERDVPWRQKEWK